MCACFCISTYFMQISYQFGFCVPIFHQLFNFAKEPIAEVTQKLFDWATNGCLLVNRQGRRRPDAKKGNQQNGCFHFDGFHSNVGQNDCMIDNQDSWQQVQDRDNALT